MGCWYCCGASTVRVSATANGRRLFERRNSGFCYGTIAVCWRKCSPRLCLQNVVFCLSFVMPKVCRVAPSLPWSGVPGARDPVLGVDQAGDQAGDQARYNAPAPVHAERWGSLRAKRTKRCEASLSREASIYRRANSARAAPPTRHQPWGSPRARPRSSTTGSTRWRWAAPRRSRIHRRSSSISTRARHLAR